MTSIRLVLFTELISVLIGVFLLHILRNTRGTVNQGLLHCVKSIIIAETSDFYLDKFQLKSKSYKYENLNWIKSNRISLIRGAIKIYQIMSLFLLRIK